MIACVLQSQVQEVGVEHKWPLLILLILTLLTFIKAKREDGRLRQFNLSCLITKDFMEAVKNDQKWKVAFPVTAKEAKG